MTLSREELECLTKEQLIETLIDCQSKVAHWRANHNNMVDRLRLFTQRNDLPVDRLPAYKQLIHLQEENRTLRATASTSYLEAIEACANHFKSKADSYANEYGVDDLGSLAFGNDRMLEYHTYLVDSEEEIRKIGREAISKLPEIQVVFESVTETGDSKFPTLTGSAEAKVKTVSLNDDGSITVSIDHWPFGKIDAKVGHKQVPLIPTEDQWGGLARDIMMWLDMDDPHTPRYLFKHLSRLGKETPKWLLDEPELKNLDCTPSKGTRCAIIYRAMIEDLKE